MLKAPPSGQSSRLRLVVESTSLQGVERLVLEQADLAKGDWVAIEPVKVNRLRDGWQRSSFETSLDPLDGDAPDHAIARIVEESRPEVEIVDVSMHVDGRQATVVRERQPFTIDVALRAHRRVPCADVHLRISRRDGVYIFWQSSGQVGKNLIDLDGACTVTFRFDPNIFGGAEYDVRVDVGNGYDIEHNFPHSQIFDRCIKAMSFTVKREWKLYDTPPVNHRFPVEVVGADTSSQRCGRARSQTPGQSAAD